ncbi:hypothetical protein NLX83_36735 [Allokutzneria sp. A3M-2-11 16]|uniref:hypothetical protein n=1 Tax=Allokutzneria sp. A3M-2-11 16 TaxID=2962043 RepID=UPI0020B8EC55|nr:hypothetical protein [Allokutzneria sp. A3M-2-11 16]MCP3804828.1 hypothetical protein [Allokutzneria sp. A3M-2-11 16]
MFRCKIKPTEVEHNLALLRELYAELGSVRPEGLRYATFQLDDGVTFVAFAELAEGTAALGQLEAFQRYRSTLEERCEEPPVMTTLSEVGSYGFR